MADIYQEIWDADQSGSGIQPVLRESDGDAERGYVVVNETVNQDPDHRIFPKVVLPEAKETTYRLCRRLFNNYVLDQTQREIRTPEEDQETFELLDAIVDSRPMRVARQYLERQIGALTLAAGAAERVALPADVAPLSKAATSRSSIATARSSTR